MGPVPQFFKLYRRVQPQVKMSVQHAREFSSIIDLTATAVANHNLDSGQILQPIVYEILINVIPEIFLVVAVDRYVG